ncbi:hypothetical protein DVB69_10275 [Sporosarcina sp. BI001-red]|uniref:hypothetical protein n=1 Tax=Sporosarcina sp. BI001-red TaxID=2282866 RepID=UPI000E23D743|nr:hypothetical protein [Sporosarcina sp. BI001-red]REB07226.1 hypothetical protein DVB69_10275 [Sporosarcina sp. BI001-red]
MDIKHQQLIAYYYQRFNQRSFDEKDVLGFLSVAGTNPQFEVLYALKELVTTRDTEANSVKSYFGRAHNVISRLGSGGQKEKIELLYSFKEIRNGLNHYFTNNGFDKLETGSISDLLLCFISLLQGIQIHSGKNRRVAGNLCFGASHKELLLMGTIKTTVRGRSVPVTFPILAVKNEYENVQKQDDADSPYLFETTIAEIVSNEGNLVVTFPEIPSHS